MGKTEKTKSKKEDGDPLLLILERAEAAADAAAAAANVAAAAAAPAAAPPTATATDALPDIVPKGRFKGYMSPGHVNSMLEECKRRGAELHARSTWENFQEWQERVAEELKEQIMHRHKLLDEIRSTHTDAPSETAAIAAAAAAADTSTVAAAAAAAAAADDATTNAAANAPNETAAATAAAAADASAVAAAAAAAAAAATAATAAITNAGAAAAAEKIARLEHELGEMTHWMRAASTPKVFFPALMDAKERDEVDRWCNSTPWGINTTQSPRTSPAPTPTQQTCRTDTQTRREHHLHSHSASSSAQPNVPAPATCRSGMRGRASGPTPTPTLTTTPGIRKDTRAHAPGVSTLLQSAPPLHSSVRPTLSLRPPTNTSMPPPQLPQRSRQDHRVTQGIPPRREQPLSSQPAFGSVQPEVSNLSLATHDLNVRTGSIPPRPTDTFMIYQAHLSI